MHPVIESNPHIQVIDSLSKQAIKDFAATSHGFLFLGSSQQEENM